MIENIKILKILLILFFVLYSYTSFSQEAPQYNLSSGNVIVLYYWKYHFGDESNFASPDFPDTNWSSVNTGNFTVSNKGIHLYRKQINFTGTQSDYDLISMAIYFIPSAYEMYWDGILIVSNGKVGNSGQSENPGNTIQKITLKRESTQPGIHTVAIKCSNYNISFFTRKLITINFGYRSGVDKIFTDEVKQDLLFFGGFFAAMLLSLMLYFGSSKNKSYLILFFIFVIDSINCLWYYTFITNSMSYVLFSYFDILYFISINISNFLLLIFLLYNFELPKKIVYIGIFIGIITLVNFLNYFPLTEKFYYEFLSILYLLIIIVLAVRIKRPGSKPALVGFVFYFLYLVIANLHLAFPDITFFNNMAISPYIRAIFWSSIFLSVSFKIKEQNRKAEEIKIKSHRLESELLKKSIQPHFLINTLSSIKLLAKKNPEKADKLIEALANEFRLISNISSEKIIPLSKEIELCEYHLEIMGCRKDAKYKIEKEIDCGELFIPPLILHTLIENGITHSFEPREDGTFWLFCKQNDEHTKLVLQNNGSLLKEYNSDSNINVKEGMGLKYVKARLEENFCKNWELAYGINNGKWEVIIIIKKQK
jgi:sensor histidine kinase YesM